MTNNNQDKQVVISADEFRLIMERLNKPSAFQQFWNWCKPYMALFIVGMVAFTIGMVVGSGFSLPSKAGNTQANLVQQAASGGAAIPFPSDFPSLSHWTSLPEDLSEEIVDSPSTNISEEISPSSPQADDGQRILVPSSRPLLRRMR